VTISDEFSIWSARVVEVQRGYQTLFRCPVRGRDFNDAPEERIRQGLLHFFVELTKDVPFVLGAERQRHDIDLRWPTSDDFRPASAPLLIVETKVDWVAGDATNQQLARYLRETKADCGVVFTGRRLWQLDITAHGFQTEEMTSLTQLADLVRRRADHDPLAAERLDFEAARAGDLNALAKLVSRLRFATFVLDIGGRETRCRDLRFSADALEFRTADYYARQRTRVSRTEVSRLVSVEA